ncbi:MAG: helix-turn-helix domain-containing protein [Actinomycetota bacterium]
MLDIAEVIDRTGLPASTLRYYEERGLIASVARRGLRRQFDDDVITRLAVISLGRDSGFRLDELRSMFGVDGPPDLDRDRVAAKADELDESIARLSAMRDQLRHIAACPASNHLECAKFRALLDRAPARRPRRPAAS